MASAQTTRWRAIPTLRAGPYTRGIAREATYATLEPARSKDAAPKTQPRRRDVSAWLSRTLLAAPALSLAAPRPPKRDLRIRPTERRGTGRRRATTKYRGPGHGAARFQRRGLPRGGRGFNERRGGPRAARRPRAAAQRVRAPSFKIGAAAAGDRRAEQGFSCGAEPTNGRTAAARPRVEDLRLSLQRLAAGLPAEPPAPPAASAAAAAAAAPRGRRRSRASPAASSDAAAGARRAAPADASAKTLRRSPPTRGAPGAFG